MVSACQIVAFESCIMPRAEDSIRLTNRAVEYWTAGSLDEPCISD